jgi:hypothetical protein
VEQVLGKVLSQIAKLQQMLLHGRFSVATRAVGAYAAAISRCRTNATISTDQNEWNWGWRLNEEESFERGRRLREREQEQNSRRLDKERCEGEEEAHEDGDEGNMEAR